MFDLRAVNVNTFSQQGEAVLKSLAPMSLEDKNKGILEPI